MVNKETDGEARSAHARGHVRRVREDCEYGRPYLNGCAASFHAVFEPTSHTITAQPADSAASLTGSNARLQSGHHVSPVPVRSEVKSTTAFSDARRPQSS